MLKLKAQNSSAFRILMWAVISAAFIGPGTVTTAAKAGAEYRLELAWALLFSVLACYTLQEASARLYWISGKELGTAIIQSPYFKRQRYFISLWIFGAIILGSAAYEAGNLMGAVAGLELLGIENPRLLVSALALGALLLLMIPSLQLVSSLMAALVIGMGLLFAGGALVLFASSPAKHYTGPYLGFPVGSELLILGLIGTTVVPYNLFLGSGLSRHNRSLPEMRLGLALAIGLGGVISLAILWIGSLTQLPFSFQSLANSLVPLLGKQSGFILGLGLFAAGFSSSITAPLASAITARSLFGNHEEGKWQGNGLNFRLVWAGVLLSGWIFGMSGLKPIPVIILAQALNGLLLPFISIFLWIIVNDARLVKKTGLNRASQNWALGLVVWATIVLGLFNAGKALDRAIESAFMQHSLAFATILLLASALSLILLRFILKIRRESLESI